MNTKKENIVGLTLRTDDFDKCTYFELDEKALNFARKLERELNAALHSCAMAQARCKQMEDQNLALRKQVDDRDRIIDRMLGHTHGHGPSSSGKPLPPGCLIKNDQYHK